VANDTNQYLQYMMASGQFRDEQQALDILKGSLQALRDRLAKVEAYRLGTQLPISLRKSYFEGWHNDQRRAGSINKSEFLAEVEFHLKGYEEHSLSELVPTALNSVLKMINGDEVERVQHNLPRSMQDIFSDSISMD
jgi:uncharacterized protein (DUF2267 family)